LRVTTAVAIPQHGRFGLAFIRSRRRRSDTPIFYASDAGVHVSGAIA
jgi:hypothetical protein